MEFLKQLVKIVSGKRVQKIETLDDTGYSKEDSQYYLLFQAIRDGKVNNDDDAAQLVYNTDKKDKKYQMLKSRLRDKLFNNLFFLDKKRYKNEHFKAYYDCYRNLFLGKIIRAHGFNNLSYSFFSKTLKTAKSFEFLPVIIDCLTELRHYAQLKLDLKNFEAFDQDLQYNINLLKKENLTQSFWERVVLETNNNSQITNSLIKDIEKYCNSIEKFLTHGYYSFNIKYNYYRLKIHYFKYTKRYSDAVTMCQKCEEEFKENKSFDYIKYSIINVYKFNNLLLLKDFKRGNAVAQKCLELLPEGRHNWFAFHQHYFLLAMHTRHYHDAFEIYQKIVNHKNFRNLFAYSKEKWRIFEAYLRFAFWNYASKSFQEMNDSLDPKQFRIHKFLNQVPTFQRDKAGMNVAILIIQVIYYLQKEQFEVIVDRIAALKQYTKRHLKRPEAYRSRQFIKMLITMELQNFNYHETKSRSQKYYDKLRKAEIQYEEDNKENLEIIPYEHLWIHVLNQLRHHEAKNREKQKKLIAS